MEMKTGRSLHLLKGQSGNGGRENKGIQLKPFTEVVTSSLQKCYSTPGGCEENSRKVSCQLSEGEIAQERAANIIAVGSSAPLEGGRGSQKGTEIMEAPGGWLGSKVYTDTSGVWKILTRRDSGRRELTAGGVPICIMLGR